MTLDQLAKGVVAHITGFQSKTGADNQDAKVVSKLREIGFAEGDEVELMHTGLLFGTPLSFRLNRTIIALRKREASLITISTVEQAASR